MPTYFAACKDCAEKLQKKLKKEKREQTNAEYEELVLFETFYMLSATEDEIKEAMTCPRCNGTNTETTLYGCGNVIMYVRGNGYLDRAGCQRDMHLHHLTTDDPYADMRVPGEVDDLKERLRRGGHKKSNPKHFVVQAEMEKAVKKAVTTPQIDE